MADKCGQLSQPQVGAAFRFVRGPVVKSFEMLTANSKSGQAHPCVTLEVYGKRRGKLILVGRLMHTIINTSTSPVSSFSLRG